MRAEDLNLRFGSGPRVSLDIGPVCEHFAEVGISRRGKCTNVLKCLVADAQLN